MRWDQELHYNITDLCHNDGVGCDGNHDDGRECVCGCHSLYGPAFVTNEDVRNWHIDPDTYRESFTWEDREYAINHGADVRTTYDGKTFVTIDQYLSHG